LKPFQIAAAATSAPAVQTTTVPNPIATQLTSSPLQTPISVQPQSFFQIHAPWLTHGIAGLFLVSAIGLVILLAIQTTKQEGLSGTIGGRVESAYRGRMGADEQLKRITGIVAGAFFFTAFLLSLTGI